MGSDEELDAYEKCHSCGRAVFQGVGECPYCHNDPYGEYDACSYCNKVIAVGAARCPYCGNYTDGEGIYQRPTGRGGMFRRADGTLYPIYVVAAWAAVFAMLLPFLLLIYSWFMR